MRQSIKEWCKEICGRLPLKNLKRYVLFKQTMLLKFFKGSLPNNFLGPFLIPVLVTYLVINFLCNLDGIPLIIPYLKNENADAREYASLALANLTTANQLNSQSVMDKNAIDSLIKLLNDKSSSSIQSNAAACLSNLTCNGMKNAIFHVFEQKDS